MNQLIFFLELEHATTKFVIQRLKSSKINIDWDANEEVKTIGEYVEAWRILLWEDAFYFVLQGVSAYSRIVPFAGAEENDNAMKRAAYR